MEAPMEPPKATLIANVIAPKNDEDFTFDVKPVERRISTRRSSLFGIDSRIKSPPAKCAKSAYAEALTAEGKQWDALIKQTTRHNAATANRPLHTTMADLDAYHREYVDSAPDFQRFAADGVEFAAVATEFLQRSEDFERRRGNLLRRMESELRTAAICLARGTEPTL